MKPYIPNPCPEKWSDMTPTDEGAMCSKCATEVIDFTNKSPEEIRQTLKAALGKTVCAKMKPPTQELEIPSHILEKSGMEGFRTRFIYALLMVFGFTLFGCESEEGYEGPVGMVTYDGDDYVVGDVEDVGKVEYVEPDSSLNDTVSTESLDTQDTRITIGQIEAPIKAPAVIEKFEEEQFIKGKVAIDPDDNDQ